MGLGPDCCLCPALVPVTVLDLGSHPVPWASSPSSAPSPRVPGKPVVPLPAQRMG